MGLNASLPPPHLPTSSGHHPTAALFPKTHHLFLTIPSPPTSVLIILQFLSSLLTFPPLLYLSLASHSRTLLSLSFSLLPSLSSYTTFHPNTPPPPTAYIMPSIHLSLQIHPFALSSLPVLASNFSQSSPPPPCTASRYSAGTITQHQSMKR